MKRNKKLFIIICVTVFIALLVGLYFAIKNKESVTENTQPQSTGDIDLNPATQEDLNRAEVNKQLIEKRSSEIDNNSTNNNSIKTVTPLITYAGQYGNQIEVGSYINEIYEEGGTCRIVFSRGSLVIKKEVLSVKSAKSTDCPVAVVETQDFEQKGAWSVVVEYESFNAKGVSAVKQIEVN